MAFDPHGLLVYSTVQGGGVINSTTGTSLQVNSGDSKLFSGNQNITVWPSGVNPNIGSAGVTVNAEVMRVTGVDTQNDTLTVTRAREGSTALALIAIGYQVANTPTPKVLTDIEPTKTTDANGWTVYSYNAFTIYKKRVTFSQTIQAGANLTLSSTNIPAALADISTSFLDYSYTANGNAFGLSVTFEGTSGNTTLNFTTDSNDNISRTYTGWIDVTLTSQ